MPVVSCFHSTGAVPWREYWSQVSGEFTPASDVASGARGCSKVGERGGAGVALAICSQFLSKAAQPYSEALVSVPAK